MRKTEDIKKSVAELNSPILEVVHELMLDIRNTLVQIHIGKHEHDFKDVNKS
jgi:hypothetical protein